MEKMTVTESVSLPEQENGVQPVLKEVSGKSCGTHVSIEYKF